MTKKMGRPKTIKGGKYATYYLDAKSLEILAQAAKVYGSASAAVRLWATQWQKENVNSGDTPAPPLEM